MAAREVVFGGGQGGGSRGAGEEDSEGVENLISSIQIWWAIIV